MIGRERCESCDAVQDVTARGAIVAHDDRGTTFTYNSSGITRSGGRPCSGAGKMSKEERARRVADRNLATHRSIAASRSEILVGLDAYIEGRKEYAGAIANWTKLALWRYRQEWSIPAVHPFVYVTRVAPNNRRAHTRGDVYCRFCGERLFVGVKRPAQVVDESPDARRHLTICALQVLSGMKESTKPGFRRLPLIDDVTMPLKPGDSGPLFQEKNRDG